MSSATRIVSAYLIVAGAWIVGSDLVLERVGVQTLEFQVLKGLLFVAVTGLVLWTLLRAEDRRRQEAEREVLAARDRAERSERQYRTLFDDNPQVMWVYDIETLRFLAVNDAAVDAYGYSRDEFLHMRISDIRPHERVLALEGGRTRAAEDQDRAGVWRHVTADGRERLVEVASHLVDFEGRRAELALVHDVTEQLAAEAGLEEATSRLRAIVDTSPMAIVMLDAENMVRLWNPAAERVFGWREEEVIGAFNPIVAPEMQGDFEENLRRTLQGAGVDGVRVRRRRADGAYIDVLLFSARLTDENGDPLGVIGLMSDITDRVAVENELVRHREHLEELIRDRTDELSRANERLRYATEIKSAFLANMSHELRTPLNSIIGFSGAMLQGLAGELNEEQAKQLGMVYRSGKHLLELINDILDLSKIEAGRVRCDVTTLDMPRIVESVTETLAPLALEKGIELRVDTSATMLPVKSDRTKIRQILTNLLGNAIKFTDAGHVQVRARTEEEWLTVEVADTGPGIPQGERALIFDEFTQSQRRADEKPEGTGLGLAISRRLARMLGGDIHLTSEVGEGSCFALRIPRVMAVQVEERETEAANGDEHTNS